METDIESCPGPTEGFNPELESLTGLRGMKIFHHNIRGLFTNKIHVSTMLKDAPKTGILALSETHANEEHPTSVYNIQGFSFVSRPRRNGKGGGIAMYLSDKIS